MICDGESARQWHRDQWDEQEFPFIFYFSCLCCLVHSLCCYLAFFALFYDDIIMAWNVIEGISILDCCCIFILHFGKLYCADSDHCDLSWVFVVFFRKENLVIS